MADALNENGEILIIQSDDFTKNGDIMCESEKGESYILSIKDFINNFTNKEIKYKIIILCFPNSYILKKYFDENLIDYKYLVTFEKLDNFSPEILKECNKKNIRFLLDLIKNSIDRNDNIDNICKNYEIIFQNIFKDITYKFRLDKNEKSFKNKKFHPKIEYHKNLKENKVYLYDPLLNIDNIDNTNDNHSKNYIPKIYNLVELLNYRNNAIFYCNETNK